ncbi:pathogenesis-related protein PR-1-like [Nymphaea colorata]|nr:pathogenesis-related protein PR-1-like [Nymphaea colorata]
MGEPVTGLALKQIILLVFLFHTAEARVLSESNKGLETEFLVPQNAARATVGEPPLAWDGRLAQYAESYANKRRADCDLRHSEGPYGENIFWGSGTDWTPADAVRDWVLEARNYDHHTNSCVRGRKCGHYTQIVWSSTTSVGCAKVTCDGGAGVFMTCNYDPPGNFVGEKPY